MSIPGNDQTAIEDEVAVAKRHTCSASSWSTDQYWLIEDVLPASEGIGTGLEVQGVVVRP